MNRNFRARIRRVTSPFLIDKSKQEFTTHQNTQCKKVAGVRCMNAIFKHVINMN